MGNIFRPGNNNAGIEKTLEDFPDIVAQALLRWRKSTLDREKVEAMLYLKFKAESGDRTATELRALINNSDERYEAVLQEISFESVYNAKNETLLAAKKLASLRTAF
jgi:hypothetical protein